MDLADIETRATELAEELSTTTSKGQAEMLALQLQGLKDLATIKALAAGNEERSVSVQLRERELAAMESVAEKIPTQAPCGDTMLGVAGVSATQYCRWPAGHTGPHRSPQGTEWAEVIEPKPYVGVIGKLRAEVDRCAGLADEEFQAAEAWRGNDESRTATKNAGDFRAEVYTEVGQRLEQILREGGLL